MQHDIFNHNILVWCDRKFCNQDLHCYPIQFLSQNSSPIPSNMSFHNFNNYGFYQCVYVCQKSLSRFFERLAILLIIAARKTESDRRMAFERLDCPQLAAMPVSALVSFAGIDDLL